MLSKTKEFKKSQFKKINIKEFKGDQKRLMYSLETFIKY